jgi:bifunctional DNA-binding transcriptional regulator/antitoxin component of YhaV-PrlF toxin-antitoxin module
VLPAPCRRKLGLKQGDEIIVLVQDGEARILTVEQAVLEAQERVRKYVGAQRSLVKELIHSRQQEAQRE